MMLDSSIIKRSIMRLCNDDKVLAVQAQKSLWAYMAIVKLKRTSNMSIVFSAISASVSQW